MLSKEIRNTLERAEELGITKEVAGSEMMAAMAFVYIEYGYDENMLFAIADAYGLHDLKLVISEGRELFEENLNSIIADCSDEDFTPTVTEVRTNKGFKALKKSILPADQVMCNKFKQELVRVPVRGENGEVLERDGRPVTQDKVLRYLEVSAIGTCRYDKNYSNEVILNVTSGEDKTQPFTDSIAVVQIATESSLKLIVKEGYFFYKADGQMRLAIPDKDISGVKFVDFLTLEIVRREDVEVVDSLFFPGQASSNKKSTLKFYLGEAAKVVLSRLEEEDVFKEYVRLIKAGDLKAALKVAGRIGQEGTQSVNMTGSKPLPIAFVIDQNGDIADLKLANGAIKMDGYMAGNAPVLTELFNNRFNEISDFKGLKNVEIFESAILGVTLQGRPTACKGSCEPLSKTVFNEYVNIIKSQGLDFCFSNCNRIEDAAVIITSSVAKAGMFVYSAFELLAFSHNGSTSNTSIQSLSQIVTEENADRIADLCIEKLSEKVDTTLFSDNEVLGLQGILNKRVFESVCINDEERLDSFVNNGALSVPSCRSQLLKSLKDLLSSSISGHSYPLTGGSGTLIPFPIDDVFYYKNGETNMFIPKLAKIADKYNKAQSTIESAKASVGSKKKAMKVINSLESKYVFSKSDLGFYNVCSYVIKYPAVGKGEFAIAHCMGTVELRRLLMDKVEDVVSFVDYYKVAEPNNIYILDSSDLQKDLAGHDFDFDHASFVTDKEFVSEAIRVRRTTSYMGTNIEELKNGTVEDFLSKVTSK